MSFSDDVNQASCKVRVIVSGYWSMGRNYCAAGWVHFALRNIIKEYSNPTLSKRPR